MDMIYLLVAALSGLVIALLVLVIRSFRRTRELLRFKDDAMKRLNKAHEELKSVDQTKTDFMNIASHELKTPLVPIVGFLHLIDREDLSSKNRESFDIIMRNVEKLQEMIDNILDTSRLESKVIQFDMEKIQLKNLIKSSAERAKPTAEEKGIELETNLPRNLPPVIGDDLRLTQVLDNLINNAIKFTEEGSVTIEAESKEDKVVTHVKDTGVGIAEEDMPKLFTKFFQAETPALRKEGGPGLGLVISKEIVEAHDGEIWAESEPGEGSKFSFSIPEANETDRDRMGEK